MAKESFDKFINKPVKGAKVKEAFRQEKKAAVRERREAIEKHYEDKRNQKAERFSAEGSNENRSYRGDSKKPIARGKKIVNGRGGSTEDRRNATGKDKSTDRKTFEKPSAKPGSGKPFVKRESGQESAGVAFGTGNRSEKPAYRKNFNKSDSASATDRPAKKFGAQKAAGAKPVYKKTFGKKDDARAGENTSSSRDNKYAKPSYKRPFEKKGPVSKSERPGKKAASKPLNYMELLPEELSMSDEGGNQPNLDTNTKLDGSNKKPRINPADKYKKKEKTPAPNGKLPFKKKEDKEDSEAVVTNDMPLNKFIAHAGICSRRDAADVVRSGKVTVNGEKIIEPAFKVTDDAEVKVDGKKIQRSRNQVYILLNKPKDYITTADDPQGRKTVMDIIKHATTERVYPVGRLDRNTSGVLLLTNDGDLAQKLSHPSFEVRKIYEVKLDKALQSDDFEKILSGVKLEDGEVHADSLAYADKDKSVVGIEIHSGKNRVVRRIFEKLGYDVRGLDRVMYANLTKKNVERGKWRFLNDKEVRLLKYFNKSKTK